MPKYHVTLKDGREVEVDAADPQKADAAAGEFMTAHPAQAAPARKAHNPLDYVGGKIAEAGGAALGKLTDDVRDDYADSAKRMKAPLPSIPQFASQSVDGLRRSGRMLADVGGLALSPVTGLMEGVAVHPAAGLMDKANLPMYEAPRLGMKRPPQLLSPDQRHAANADMVRMALMAGGARTGPLPELAALEGAPRGMAAGGLLPRARANMPPTPRAAPPPRIPQRATAYVDRVARSAGATPETIAAAAEAARGRPITGAEAIGQPGKAALGALARRPGQTGDALSGAVSARQVSRPERMQQDFAEAAGVMPEAAQADIEALVQAGRQKAAPLYEQAYAAGPVYNPKLEDLLRRPSMKAAMGRAYKLAAEEGQNPEGLGLVDVEIPGAWDSIAPQVGEVASTAAKGPARPPSRGDSLLRFISKNGGVSDAADELAAIGADRWHVGKAYARPLNGSGSTLDDMALRAHENGYFPDLQGRPTERDLLDAMRDEMSGRARYARPVDEVALGRYQGREAADELAYRGGDPADVPSPEQYGGRPGPQFEPAHQFQPTARTWDYVKRGLDDELHARRDPVTGKLPKDGHTRALVSTLKELRGELTSANPAYGEALRTSGDYLSAEQAFKDGGRFVFDGRFTERQLAQHMEGLGEAERTAFKGGIANRVYDLAQNGKLDPKALRTPRVQAKLRQALGRDEADALIRAAGDEGAMQAFERRYAPGAGSVTAEMQDAMALQDREGALGQMAGDFLGNLHRGPIAGVGAAISNQIRNVGALARTPGLPIGARDIAGDMLLGNPQSLAQALRAYREAQPQRRGMIGRGLAKPGALRLPPPMLVAPPKEKR